MSEVRALLLTDLVDSTMLSQKLGDETAAALWSAHDRIARELLHDWHGREIDKSDGFLILFANAADAAGYALAYHRAIGALEIPLKARAGLHVGPVTLRGNTAEEVALGAKPLEVDGIAKSVAARVMAAARGGQTLLTADAVRSLGECGFRLQSHGHWRMKGLSDPIELFQVGDDDTRFDEPIDTEKVHRVVRQGRAWVPARKTKHGLPAERDSFVGRDEALGALGRLFREGARLVSILGIGGCGKTRLATRFAWSSVADVPGGAWFCDLTPARSVDGIAHAVARTFDVALGKQDPVEQLGNAIADRGQCLVILDNFEQVAQFAEETLGRWLDRASAARFLVTTRDILGLQGEQTLALPPLSVGEAEVLFMQRAEAANHEFQPTPEDVGAISQLAKLLDGLPLAIELAAARVRVMSPRQILARMSKRFKLLASTGARRDRQATLRSTLDWSWNLLSDAEKAALAQLSVFEGGFTLESAESVLDLDAYDAAAWPAAAVQSLVDKSFVRLAERERFGLLVSVQEYAAEHLGTEGRYPGSGPAALARAEERHLAHFAGFGEARAAAGRGAEVENLVVACRRAVARGDARRALAVLEGAWAALRNRGTYRVAIELAQQVERMTQHEPDARARINHILGIALNLSGRLPEARRHLELAIAQAHEAGLANVEAAALDSLGFLAYTCGDLREARACYEAELTIATRTGDLGAFAHAEGGLANIASLEGSIDLAVKHFETALEAARKHGDRRLEGRCLGNLAMVHVEHGRMAEGRAMYDATLAMARELGDRQWEANTLCNSGLLYQLEGRMEEAREALERSLAMGREMAYPRLVAIALCNLGILLHEMRQLADARRHFEDALACAIGVEDRRSVGQIQGYLARVHAHEGRSAQARECIASAEAIFSTIADPVSHGIIKCCRAETEQLAGSHEAARAALAEAQSLATQAGAGPRSELGLAIARIQAMLGQERATVP